MKTIKVLALVIAIGFSSLATATNPTPKKSKEKTATIEKTISNLLENPRFAVNEELSTSVILIVNDENELVVLNVNTEDTEVESWVKLRLNYKKLDFNFEHKNKPLKMPLTLLSK